MNYYNEHDIKTAAWLRELINQGHLPPGDVDTRSIVDVCPADLTTYTQCHFFAGIGGWSYALQLAGTPATTRLWTGSCPCQPFSSAGKGLAQADERHLWPVFFDLIRQCRPELVFGEQVASAIGKGWLDGVSADLDSEGYACGAAVLGAHSIGAPHIRQRLYWVAHHHHQGSQGCGRYESKHGEEGWEVEERHLGEGQFRIDGLGDTERQQHERRGGSGDMGRPSDQEQGEAWERQRSGDADSGSSANNPWRDSSVVHCRDSKTRRIPTEPSFFPLAHGVPARVVRLRGYGNAIVPQAASEFIKAFEET